MDINKLKAAIRSRATPQSYVPKLKAQLEKAEADYESVKSGKKSAPKASKQVKSTLDKLKEIIKKKKYGAYRAQRVDLKKDADRPALPTGKRKSKSGNTYYEYRANRIDVKQPPKRYPKLAYGGYMAEGGKTLIGKEFRPFTATSSNEYNVEIVDIDLDNVTYKYKDGEVKKAKTSDFLNSYIQVKEKGGYMADGGYMAKGGVIDSLLVDQTNFLNELTDIKLSADLETEAGVANYRSKIAPIKEKLKAIDSQLEELGYEAYEKGGYMAKGGSIWTEIRDDFEEDGVVYIDAWTTSDDNEEGKVIAKVKENGEVIYLDERAKKDSLAQEVINDVKKSMMAEGGDTEYAKGGETHRIEGEDYFK
ncbi:MAG: hypothetical protein FJY17_00005 [Bacteroidetes bacterium]|nr:hypothetical protein [Bacteroidota bacterium]